MTSDLPRSYTRPLLSVAPSPALGFFLAPTHSNEDSDWTGIPIIRSTEDLVRAHPHFHRLKTRAHISRCARAMSYQRGARFPVTKDTSQRGGDGVQRPCTDSGTTTRGASPDRAAFAISVFFRSMLKSNSCAARIQPLHSYYIIYFSPLTPKTIIILGRNNFSVPVL